MERHKQAIDTSRLRYLALLFLLLALWIVVRLFMLQVVDHNYLSLFASNSHEIYQNLVPRRGSIYFQDTRTKAEYPAAVNRDYYSVYAVPREIERDQVGEIVAQLGTLLPIEDEEEIESLRVKLLKEEDPYELVAKRVDETKRLKIEEKELPGIYFTTQDYRFYPENNLAGPVLGFIGSDKDGNLTGRYGAEGYWQNKIAGQGGILTGEKGALGSWIATAGRTMVKPEDGADLLLTIDRTLQYKACEFLRTGLNEYKAASAALVMMDPKTGAIIAMCSLPDFDPNKYSEVDDIIVYNNSTIFTPYEPGSVFKPLTMAAALDQNLVNPNTVFHDPCSRKIDGFTIRNAMSRCYGDITMTEILEKSVNTGMIWLSEQLGRDRFYDYVKKFGFGQLTGVALNTEVAGDISALEKNGAVYSAVGAFGQGLTVTPLQLASAYSALANKGKLPKAYIVEEVRYQNGKVERFSPVNLEAVVSEQAAGRVKAMLTSVVEVEAKAASLKHYYVAGKTGTAQIAGPGGYTDETNHTFAGFAPANNPKLVIVIRYEKPQRQWALATAAPVFNKVMKFALDYYGIPGER
jgi:stage V sporulation protein D (sporulation-specific penicillin-binding protein)